MLWPSYYSIFGYWELLPARSQPRSASGVALGGTPLCCVPGYEHFIRRDTIGSISNIELILAGNAILKADGG